MKSTKIAALAASLAALAVIGPGSASALPGVETGRLIAVNTSGQSLTCSVALHDHRYTGSTYHKISGSTTCGGAIQQSCTLTHVSKTGAPDTVLSDSVFGTTCALASGDEGEFSGMTYRTVVQAPGGMVWAGAPGSCKGQGTSTLDCTFSTGESPL